MQIVKVRLRKPRRVFSFLCGDSFLINRDDACIVQSDHGSEWGTCILPPEFCPVEMEHHYPMRLIRRANANDFKTVESMLSQEQKAHQVCFEKIRKRSLPMKLVDVEYTFDQRKVIFYFTAEERVDFRELVRDLAHDLRARIELRHIQVRDEAKLVGGLGSCGRMLCCSTWLNEFKPISMRMAKRQNLSLNPTKISGQCGRLLCCLNYEYENYEGTRKKPKPEAPPKDKAPAEEEETNEAESATEEASEGAEGAKGSQDPDHAPRKRRRRKKKKSGGNEAGKAEGGAA